MFIAAAGRRSLSQRRIGRFPSIGPRGIGGEAHHHHVGLVCGRYVLPVVTRFLPQSDGSSHTTVAEDERCESEFAVSLPTLRFVSFVLSANVSGGVWSELQAVFRSVVEWRSPNSGFEAGRLILRELVGLPQAIIYEHLRERERQR